MVNTQLVRVTPKHRKEIRLLKAYGETIDEIVKRYSAWNYTYHQVDYALRSERRKELRTKKASSNVVRH